MNDEKAVPLIELKLKLEKVTQEVLKNQGFNPDTEKLILLLELVKEQVPNENSRP